MSVSTDEAVNIEWGPENIVYDPIIYLPRICSYDTQCFTKQDNNNNKQYVSVYVHKEVEGDTRTQQNKLFVT